MTKTEKLEELTGNFLFTVANAEGEFTVYADKNLKTSLDGGEGKVAIISAETIREYLTAGERSADSWGLWRKTARLAYMNNLLMNCGSDFLIEAIDQLDELENA